ncbi:MAG: 4-(cytidine 5'-diphospho)-2-C-methyl-D-erythritol kinase [Candidatus Sedimenticola sp. (ex Thyasira tokunagai)]
MSGMDSTDWPAPAKLNLMLRIVGQRDDGYHLLQTVFQFLDKGDRLGFRLRDDGKIVRLREVHGVAANDDLVVQAARLLQEHAGVGYGVDILLDKRLPMGGGLGGGSSDAATTLVALNHLWKVGLDFSQLTELGLSLGADVPVFIHGEAAWGEGVGERLQTLVLPEPWYLVIIPPCHVSTADVFTDPQLTRDSPRMKIADFLAGSARNDCLDVVVKNYPEVAAALEWLGQYAEARLTGTGACIFAAFESEASAQSLLERLPAGNQGFVARGVNHSPLKGCLESRVAAGG